MALTGIVGNGIGRLWQLQCPQLSGLFLYYSLKSMFADLAKCKMCRLHVGNSNVEI